MRPTRKQLTLMLTVIVEYRTLLNAPGSAAHRAQWLCYSFWQNTGVVTEVKVLGRDVLLAEPSVIRRIEACPQCVYKTSQETKDKI